MGYRPKSLLPALAVILVIPSASALAQIGGRAGIGGVRPGIGGARGLSSPRSGMGVRSNPIVNPSPSLTPHETLNPRGSLSSGQVLNPAPSLRRPRSGGEMPGTQRSVASGGLASRRARPSSRYTLTSRFNELANELRRRKNGEAWVRYLALSKTADGNEQTEGASDEARELLNRFDKLSNDPRYAKVTDLHAFWLAHRSLKDTFGSSGSAAQSSAHPNNLNRRPLPVGDRILQSVVSLDGRLTEVAPGSDWPKRLSLDELKVLISTMSHQPANPGERKSVEDILRTYQSVEKNKDDAVVNQLPEFKETLDGLREYLSPPDARLRQELRLTFGQLGDQLREYKNGESWVEYLDLPRDLISEEKPDSAGESTTKLLTRFNKLINDPSYAKVTALRAFGPAYESLKAIVDLTGSSHDPATVSVQPSDAAADQQPDPAAEMKAASKAEQQPVATADKDSVAIAEPSPIQRPTAGEETEPRPTDLAPSPQSAGERLLKSVVALDEQLAQVVPGTEWPKRLLLDELRVGVSMTSEQPSSDGDRKSLTDILETYQAIANNKDDAVVNGLPEFKQTLDALRVYLQPLDARQ